MLLGLARGMLPLWHSWWICDRSASLLSACLRPRKGGSGEGGTAAWPVPSVSAWPVTRAERRGGAPTPSALVRP